MLAIKLKRVGKKHQATFRVIVAEKRSKVDGRFVDDLGWLNPHTNSYSINNEAALKWIGHGAKPTDTVHNLLVRAKVIEGKKIPLHNKKSKKKEEEVKAEVTNIKETSVNKPEAEVKKGEEKPEENGKGRVEKSEENDMTQINNNDEVKTEAVENKEEAPVEVKEENKTEDATEIPKVEEVEEAKPEVSEVVEVAEVVEEPKKEGE